MILTSSSFSICSSVGGAGAGVDDDAGVVGAGACGIGTETATAREFEGPSVPTTLAGTAVPGLGGSEGCSGDPATG